MCRKIRHLWQAAPPEIKLLAEILTCGNKPHRQALIGIGDSGD